MQYWEANQRKDLKVLGKLRHPDWVAEWPQSGEKIVGHENDTKIHENYPGYPEHQLKRAAGEPDLRALSPMLTPVRVRGEGEIWAVEAFLVYPDSKYHCAGVLELSDGLIWRETFYWAAPFEAPEWRHQISDRMPEKEDPPNPSFTGAPDTEGVRRSAIERYFAAPLSATNVEEAKALYLEEMKKVFHNDLVLDLPQSGERLAGLDKALKMVEGHPDFPSGDLRRITSIGDLVVIEAKLNYKQGTFWEVMFWEYRESKVQRSIEYFAEAFDPPGWRRQWVELV